MNKSIDSDDENDTNVNQNDGNSFDLEQQQQRQQQQQQPSFLSSTSRHNNNIDNRPFGLGSSSYAEISRSRASNKKRSLEANKYTRGSFDGSKTPPPNTISNSNISSVGGSLVVDDLEQDEIKILTAKPRDISVLPQSKLSPSLLALSQDQPPQQQQQQMSPVSSPSATTRRQKNNRSSSSSSGGGGGGGGGSSSSSRKSLSPRNRRRRTPNRSVSPKRNIAFGIPAELDSARDSHHRAHPKMGARQYFDQYTKRSKLATSDDVNSAERRRLLYRFPTQSNSAAQTPEQFHGALAVMAERSAVEDLLEERKKRQDTLQVLEWERVRHNESLSEEKMKYDKYLEKQKEDLEKEKQAALILLSRENERKILEERKRYEKKLQKELEKTEDTADDKLARAKEKFNRSRVEFEKKALREKKMLEDRLKKEQKIKKENEKQQEKLLALVSDLEEEVEETKKRSALSERRASLASEALDYERETSMLANESIDEQHELMNMVQQLEKERDDAQRREAIAREALKREKLRKNPNGKYWTPNSYSSPKKLSESGIMLDRSNGSNNRSGSKRSPFLRRTGSGVKQTKREKIRNLASGKVVATKKR